MPETAAPFDPVAEELLAAARERRGRHFSRSERLTYWLSSAAFAAATLAFVLLGKAGTMPGSWVVVLLVATYAVACRLEFEIGSAAAVATELVVVEMLFLLPPSQVPLWVALGSVLAQAPEYALRIIPVDRALVAVGSSWFAFGPALVFELFHGPAPSLTSLRTVLVLAVALAAQFAVDAVSLSAREWAALRVPPKRIVGGMTLVFSIDLALAPIGLLAAIAAQQTSAALLLPLPLLAIIGISAREHRQGMSQTLELSSAYRGTAFLLGDVVAAADAYTGAHSRDVLDLVLSVAGELRVDARSRLNAEFTALLHDVGKIKLPAAIINKPGPLTREERAIVNMHTIEGQRLLERVGGRLAEVGRIVRSCHERWDGGGYPDGLAGEEIPLVARIVSCCDAFSAMTTHRAYREALSLEAALEEVRANAGTQFDPAVAETLLAVLATDRAPERSPDLASALG